MKRVALCQVSIMFESQLPNEVDLNCFLNRIAECVDQKQISINNPIPREMWGQLPAEVPRAVVQNQNINAHFTANNLLVALKVFQQEWIPQIEEIIKVIDSICSEIGNEFNLAYRAGIVLTTNADNVTLSDNISAIIDQEILKKEEWQISYLDKFEKSQIALNRWKRYIKNSNMNQYSFIVDVNSEANNRLKLRENKVLNTLEVIKDEILEAYNGFKE